jgi:hypothetical protein
MKKGTKKGALFSTNTIDKRLQEQPLYFFDLDFLLLDSDISHLSGSSNIKELIKKINGLFDENGSNLIITYTINKRKNEDTILYRPDYDLTISSRVDDFDKLNLFDGLKLLHNKKIIKINSVKTTKDDAKELTFKISLVYPEKVNFAVFDANNKNRLTIDFETGVYEYKGRKAKIKNGTQPYAILYILSANKGIPMSFDELKKSANELIRNTNNHLHIEKQIADAIRTIRLKVKVKDGEYFPVKKNDGLREKNYLFEIE